MKVYTSESEKTTKVLAKEFILSLLQKDIPENLILLEGNLGAGKTTFTKGLAEALEIPNLIQSPTYTLIKTYPINLPYSVFKKLMHIDLYRIKNAWEVQELEIGSYLQDNQLLMVVEWPGLAKDLWINIPSITVNIELGEDFSSRKIIIT